MHRRENAKAKEKGEARGNIVGSRRASLSKVDSLRQAKYGQSTGAFGSVMAAEHSIIHLLTGVRDRHSVSSSLFQLKFLHTITA